jgi:hypothetical protein
MIKKRAMSKVKWEDYRWDDITDVKRLETGYADHQPKWPYWVEPRHYSEAAWLDMNAWMIDTFGSGNWGIPNVRWVGSDRKYWFRDAADRTFFILRWS